MAKVRCHITMQDDSSCKQGYCHAIQMYTHPPEGTITLEDLNKICSDRLRVLKLVDRVALNNYGKSSQKCKILLTKELAKHGLLDYVILLNGDGCKENNEFLARLRRNDQISHFILRLTFAFKYEKKKWFFKQEVRLFKWRLTSLNRDALLEFKNRNGFSNMPISADERKELAEFLQSFNGNVILDEAYYKIHFTEVLDLIKKRRVFLKKGLAFVPQTKLSSLFVTEFKRKLQHSFQQSREIAARITDDGRISRIFRTIGSSVEIRNYVLKVLYQISVEDLDDLSQKSYPLCMRLLHDALKAKHHLTNGGRVQYCLFLKGIGISLGDSLKFWKTEFIKTMSQATFMKEYSYNIRHLYGKEGKRANYTPYSCSKIIRSAIGPRDDHGCPFRTLSPAALTERLHEYRLSQKSIEVIVDLCREGQYQSACKKYFNVTNEYPIQTSIEHPNLYFNESMKQLQENLESD